MTNKPQLSDVMTPNPVTVQLGQPLSEVYNLFQTQSFHHVPIIDGDDPVGMISATDILKLVYDAGTTEDTMLRTMLDYQFTLEDAMSTSLLTVEVGAPVKEVADYLSTGSVHSVLVLDVDGTLAGIVTSSDLIRQLSKLL